MSVMKKEQRDDRRAAGPLSEHYIIDIEHSPIMLMEWDIVSDTMTYSQKWAEIFGPVPDCAQARKHLSANNRVHPEDVAACQALRNEVAQGAPYSSAQLRILNKAKAYVWYRVHVINQFDQNHEPVRAIGLVFDINKDMLDMERLRNRAERDALTGLLNREETEARIKQHLQRKPARRCALFMIDADNFKQINDSKGHMLGDVVLAELAAGMKKLMRESDIVGRIGGDEFAIFMKDISTREAAEQKAGELAEMFRHLFEAEKQRVRVTCSIGVALYPEDGMDYPALYKCADQALYQAKSLGKNQYALYDSKCAPSLAEAGYSSLGATIDSEGRAVGASSDLVNLVFKILYDMEDGDHALNLVLEVVGKRFDVSRAYIFEQDEDDKHCSNTFEWCNEGIVPEIENLQCVESAHYSELFDEHSIFYCRDTSTLPPDASALMEEQGVYSTLQCAQWEERPAPAEGKRFSGFVGFDECTGHRLWTQEEVASLSLISEILTTFLLKRRLQERNSVLTAREREVFLIEEHQHKAAEASIVECIQWLSSSEYLADAVEYTLHIVQEYYQSDRVYIIETYEERGVASNTYEICAPGVEPQIEMLQDVPIEAISFWMEQFSQHEYIKVEDVDMLGEDRRMEREVLKAQQVNSLIAVPLHVKGEFKGFLGVDDPKRHKDEVHYLRGLSYFLANEMLKKALQLKLEKLSYSDTMTGLENRNSYMAYCDDFFKRQPAPVGVMFMDINGLKKLNDRQGHVCGDLLIVHTANVMRKYFPNERKFRLSGDEFLIVTETMCYEQFQRQLHEMKKALSDQGQCVVSIGTTWSDIGTDLNELQNKADRLMYISKQDYYKENKGLSFEKIPLFRGMSEAILNKEYLVYLQPKLHLKTNRVDGAEVLIRYREKDGSIAPPNKFIPLLENEGLISHIDFFVMREVCELLTAWKGTSLSGIKLALNFSRITLFDEHFWEQFWGIFRQYDLCPDQLEIEITETQETLNKRQMARLLDELKKHGFRIALDDFGVEYSSYEFLMMARFDLLKIDRSIIQKYGQVETGRMLVKHMIEMSHSIGSQSCAEGVETEEQLAFLREIGCDYVQGFLLDKPMPVEAFTEKYK